MISRSNILWIGFKTGGLYLFLEAKNISKADVIPEFKAWSTCYGQSISVKNILLWKSKLYKTLKKPWRIQFWFNKGIQFSSALNKGSGLKTAPYLAKNTLEPLSHGVSITAPASRTISILQISKPRLRVSCPGSHGLQMAEPGFEPCIS